MLSAEELNKPGRGNRFTDFPWLEQVGKGAERRMLELYQHEPSVAPAKLGFKGL